MAFKRNKKNVIFSFNYFSNGKHEGFLEAIKCLRVSKFTIFVNDMWFQRSVTFYGHIIGIAVY